MLSLIISVCLFVYVLSRISRLEEKIDKAMKGGAVVPAQSLPTQQARPAQQPPVQPVGVPQPQPHAAQQAVPPVQRPAADSSHAEFAVGSRVMTAVGILAVLLAVGFFLRYAFEHNIISETGRVILGVVFGAIVAFAGHFLRKKYQGYGYSLVGAGLGIAYISLYAAYSFYDMLTAPAAFAAMLLVTAIGVVAALLYSSQALLVYAFVGAFLMPLLLPLEASSLHAFFAYLLVINSAVLLIARFKVWPHLTVASLAGTGLLYLYWIFGPYTDADFLPTFLYCTVLFLIYFCTSALNFVFRDRNYKGIDGFLVYGVPTLYFVLNLPLLNDGDEVAFFSLMIGLFYAAMAMVLRAGFGQVGDITKFSNALIATASPYIALSIALHFDGSAVTMLWAIQAALMVLIGTIIGSRGNRVTGIVLSVVAGLHLLLIDPPLRGMAEPIFNARTATAVMVVLMYAVIWVLYQLYGRSDASRAVGQDEKQAGRYIGALGAVFVAWLWIIVEASDFMEDAYLYIPALWAGLFLVLVSISFVARESIYRVLAYVGIGVGLLMAISTQSDLPTDHYVVLFNIRTLTVLVYSALLFFALWLIRTRPQDLLPGEQKMAGALAGAISIAFLWFGSVEIVEYFNAEARGMAYGLARESLENTKRVLLSAYWLLYALLALGLGISLRSAFLRYFSICLFGITIFKVFLYDTANMDDIYRFVSYLSLGIVLLLSSFFYYRFKDRIVSFVKAQQAHE